VTDTFAGINLAFHAAREFGDNEPCFLDGCQAETTESQLACELHGSEIRSGSNQRFRRLQIPSQKVELQPLELIDDKPKKPIAVVVRVPTRIGSEKVMQDGLDRPASRHDRMLLRQ
jgi:hypothetical protein